MRHRPSRGAMAITVSAMLAAAGALAIAPGAAMQAKAAVSSGGISVAYYDQWSDYANNWTVKDLITSGAINHLNYLIYDFENIDPTTHQCFEAEKGVDQDPAGESDPNAADGAGDMDADYGKPFAAADAVNGQADTSGQLAGNFHQLQELKAAYPNLKILLSIGGWTYSKYFSDAAATAASRQAFVSSCINMFIKGNLPADPDYGVTPAPGAIAGLFSGFDIDWEYPGSTGGHLGNIVSPSDGANYTLLLQEFRNELNTLTASTGQTYSLTAALPSGQDKIAQIQTNQIAQYLDFGDLMTYDMHTAWNPFGPSTGPTDFQDPIYNDPNEPGANVAPGNEKYSISNAVNAWVNGDSQYGIPGGFPANKLTLGVPFYYRGWTGVPNTNNGVFQTATNAATGATYSGNVPGIQMYKELTSGPYSSGTNILNTPADTFYDPTTESAYFYDGTNWWTGLSPQSIQSHIDFMHCQGMAGVMMFSMYDLDPTNPVLFNDVENDLGTTPSSCPSGPPSTGNDFSVSVSPSSGSVTAGNSATSTVSTAVTSGSAESVSLSASGAPSGVTVLFSPASVTSGSSSTMTVATSSSVAAGTYPITVTGTAASGSHPASYSLTVTSTGGTSNDFSVSLSPASGSVTAGSSATSMVSTAVTSGSAESVSLSASGAPSGVTVSFSPASVTSGSSSTMTVATSSSVAAGMYPITVTGTAASGSHTATYSLTVTSPGSTGGALVNGGFETGSLSPWVCQPGDVVVTSPVHSGSYAAAISPGNTQTGECDQTLTLSPNTSYTLSGWVQGNYAFIGVSGGATASTWTISSGWTQLTVPFTTGSSGTVTIYVHGWYGQGNVYADDLSVA